MEAGSALAARLRGRRTPAWLTGLLPLLVLAVGIAAFVWLGAPGLERRGAPIEELAVDRTVLEPGTIELHVTNDGPDPVAVEQVLVNDAFAEFSQTEQSIDRLGSGVIQIEYPWVEGENYEVALLTATGATIDEEIEAATATPEPDAGFYGLMAMIGLYVGVIPVAIGMLWLPWVRRVDERLIQFLLALTVGLLAFLGIDAVLDGTELVGPESGASQSFGGAALVYVGAVVAYLALSGVDAYLGRREGGLRGGAERQDTATSVTGHGADRRADATGALKLAFLVALGVGLHNLGEGLAIGSAYAVGSLALGATLIVGFALHNTTEGLAIVAPVARWEASLRERLPRLVGLGILAGAPVIVGAWIGASAFNPSVAAFMLGLGAGAIARVVVQVAVGVRDRTGRLLHPVAVAGGLTGLALMYLTGLLVPL